MKSKMLSVVTGTSECISHCPFCVSCTKPEKTHISSCLNLRNFLIALKYADICGVDTMVFTGRGEPLLYPEHISAYLKIFAESKSKIPFVELQTNGILIPTPYIHDYLKKWFSLGLTHVALSVISEKDELNKKNYGVNTNLANTIKILHDIGLSVRLVAIMCKGDFYIDSDEKIQNFIDFAAQNNVEQITLRPVNEEFRRQSAHDWIETHKFSDTEKISFMNYLESKGTVLMELPRIGKVYDINGQNVMFSYPLNINTRNADTESARQIIYFPDGHIRYEWEKEGGILL